MKLSIMTLNFKKKELTLSCVKSLYQQYKKQFERNEFEVIVVDNFSEDDSVTFLKKEFKKNKFVNLNFYQNSENSGFGSGNNFGAKYAKGQYLLFLNNDTTVWDGGLLGMIDAMDSRTYIGILGGKMENENKTPQPSAGKFYSLFNVVLLLLGLQRFGITVEIPTKIKKVDWVSGGSMMIRRSLFEKIGGFDDKIFMYVEDVDICFRAKKLGFLTYYYPYVSIIHAGQGSSDRTFAVINIYRGLITFYKKHLPYWQLVILMCILKAKAKILIISGKLFKNNYLVSTYEKALKIF